jgi:hypothetical protein
MIPYIGGRPVQIDVAIADLRQLSRRVFAGLYLSSVSSSRNAADDSPAELARLNLSQAESSPSESAFKTPIASPGRPDNIR